MQDYCREYWRGYGVWLLSEFAAIPPEVQHKFLEKYEGDLIYGSAYMFLR